MKSVTERITYTALIAAVYVVLTLVSAVFGLTSGAIQLRISECLCILPFFTEYAVAGLFIGCFISNLLCGGMILDAVFGSLATLAAAFIVLLLSRISKSKAVKIITPLPNVIINAAVIPFVLKTVYMTEGAYWYFFVTVGVGELISSAVFGIPLLFALEKRSGAIFRKK